MRIKRTFLRLKEISFLRLLRVEPHGPYAGPALSPLPLILHDCELVCIQILQKLWTCDTLTPLVRRYASTSNLMTSPTTPAPNFNHLSLATPPPSPPSILMPLHARIRALLRPTCNNSSGITGREQERAMIQNFISSFLTFDTISSTNQPVLYVSGSPGTGKTALVNALLHTLDPEIQRCHAKILSVNCMALGSVDAVWERLAEELADGEKVVRGIKSRKAKDSSAQIVQRLLAERQSKWYVIPILSTCLR